MKMRARGKGREGSQAEREARQYTHDERAHWQNAGFRASALQGMGGGSQAKEGMPSIMSTLGSGFDVSFV
jgi:hypothetical protein